jgi:hypothetical protein
LLSFQELLQREWRHLTYGVDPGEHPGGLGTNRFIARSKYNSQQTLDRAKAVLKIVNENSAGEWPSDARWRELLPDWFVSRCAPEMTKEEAQAETIKWRKLTREEQVRWDSEHQWSLGEWLYWLQPGKRQWYWWDGVALDDNTAVIAVEVQDWPFPWGALGWLLRAAGADEVEAEK